ncbi:MAG: hypothetical protein ACREOB_04525 [Thermodesulfobacteriota bacterium]
MEQLEWIGYCAGLYEGEGSVGCYSHTHNVGTKTTKHKGGKQYRRKSEFRQSYIVIQISMTDLMPLELFRETMDVGNINGPYQRKPQEKEFYMYSTSKQKDVIYIRDTLWSYLSERRKDQFIEAFDKFELYKKGLKSTPTDDILVN